MLSETVYCRRVENIAISLAVASIFILIVAAVAKVNHWQGAATLVNLSINAWPLLGINALGLLKL